MVLFMVGVATGLTLALAMLIILARSPRLQRAIERAAEADRKPHPLRDPEAAERARTIIYKDSDLHRPERPVKDTLSTDAYRRASGFEERREE